MDLSAPVAPQVPLVVFRDICVPLTPKCQACVCCWLRMGVLEEGVPLRLPLPMLTLFMDVFSSGWGTLPGFVSIRSLVGTGTGRSYKQLGDESCSECLC